jgi:hypothetical protein
MSMRETLSPDWMFKGCSFSHRQPQDRSFRRPTIAAALAAVLSVSAQKIRLCYLRLHGTGPIFRPASKKNQGTDQSIRTQ